MSEQQGVTITLREIYDSVQEINIGMKRFEEQARRLEDNVKEIKQIDEKSTEALSVAKEAKSGVIDIKGTLNKIGVGIILALVVGAIGTLFHFAKVMGG